jgi:hypothetical protein
MRGTITRYRKKGDKTLYPCNYFCILCFYGWMGICTILLLSQEDISMSTVHVNLKYFHEYM